MNTQQPIKLFYSYSHADEDLRRMLEKHLSVLSRTGVIAGWHDRQIPAGAEWEASIDSHLESAQIILLLISADFLASDYCYERELHRAMAKHEEGSARVIPVILRACDWIGTPFSKLQALPKDGKAINQWGDFDTAFTDVANGIKRAITEINRTPLLETPLPVAVLAINEKTGSPIREFHPNDLSVPPTLLWRKLPPPGEEDTFRLLDWHTRLTPLVGREDDLAELIGWAKSEAEIAVRFLVGPGGSGKTRLAFEVADALRKEGWMAGQSSLDRSHLLQIAEKGLLLIIDYPESVRDQVSDLLFDLARIEKLPAPIRVLCLSRSTISEWQHVIDAAGAASICDVRETQIGPLEIESAIKLFNLSIQHFSSHFNASPGFIPDGALTNWLNQNESHSLPLIIVAAALHHVLYGNQEFKLTATKIVEALVRRERKRLDKIGEQAHWGEKAASRLFGLATASGGLDKSAIRRLSEERELGLPNGLKIDEVKKLGFWHIDRLPAPTPDIVAAELLFEALNDCPDEDEAGAWLWACLGNKAPLNIDRLGRIAYDIATLQGATGFTQFTNWLVSAVSDSPHRAKEWHPIFEDEYLPLGVRPLAVAIGKTLLKSHSSEETERANILQVLSNRLSDIGETKDALTASHEAVEIYRRLVSTHPKLHLPDLARSLRNLSICLRVESSPSEEALESGIESADIYERLTTENPDKYEVELAKSLHNLACCLSDLNRNEIAMEAINKATELWRRLVLLDPALHEPGLVLALMTEALILFNSGDKSGELKTIQNAATICRRLATMNPARYEAALARCLNHLSRSLKEVGDNKGASEAIKESVAIYARVATASPIRYEPDLLRSLNNLTNDLSEARDLNSAATNYRKAIEVQLRLVLARPELYEPGLAKRLNRQLADLNNAEEAPRVFEKIQIAEKTVCVLLVRGQNPEGGKIFAYVAVRMDKLEGFMEAQRSGLFYPQRFGVIVESGEGEPSPEVRKKMETEYGFNHEGMIDIPNPEKAYEMVANIVPDDITV